MAQRCWGSCGAHRTTAVPVSEASIGVVAPFGLRGRLQAELCSPLPRRLLSRWNADGGCRWYVEVTLLCGHPYRVRLNGDAADRAAGYNRAEHVRMHSRGSEIYAESYGWRNDSESFHSQLDLWLYRGRMIGLALERQALVMRSFPVTINAIADWYAKHRDAERRQ